MKRQRIIKARDLLAGQRRITMLMECRHIVSITALELSKLPVRVPVMLFSGEVTEWECPYCPDPPAAPPEVTNQDIIRKWKEAGEP